ncbi:hypothetical protein [uncultured Legionella sp.]|uniref:hypothetical protein n=1 Tax=uncultured Legionella sp. TaxID=210934 RepID=UPI00261DE124|nr:hypothetical protein [uncultured Legionella sp.]
MTSDVVEEDTGEQTVWGPFDTLPAMKVALTTACRDTFEKLSPREVLTAYLCGGAVLDLIENTTKANDLDFVISLKDINFLNLLGYRRDAYNNNSYFINSPYRVDVKVLPYAPFYHILEMGWMREDIKTCDFNICKLYCDRDGSIYDPTGRGLFDLNARILSMAGNEKEKLENSPARIIRAMKYMQRGFYPDDALDLALRNFNSLHPEKISHVYSVTRKLLKNSDDDAKQVFLENLRCYGLLGTLFGLDHESTLDDLSARISPKPPIFYGTTQKGASLLFQKPETVFSPEISCEQNTGCNLF